MKMNVEEEVVIEEVVVERKLEGGRKVLYS